MIISRKQNFLNYLKDPTRARIESACKEFQNNNDHVTFIGVIDETEIPTEYAIKITTDKFSPSDLTLFAVTLLKYVAHLKIKTVAPDSFKHWCVGPIFFVKFINTSNRIFYLLKND